MKSWKGGTNGAEANSYRRTLINTTLAQKPLNSLTTADILAMLSSMPGGDCGEDTHQDRYAFSIGPKQSAIDGKERILPVGVVTWNFS